MDSQVSSMIEEARQAIIEKTGQHLRLPFLYGSEARGEATPESDVDLLVIVDVIDPQTKKAVKDAVYDIMWRYDFLRLISLHFRTASDFQDQALKGYGFVRNVEEEGIALWRAA